MGDSKDSHDILRGGHMVVICTRKTTEKYHTNSSKVLCRMEFQTHWN